jgi:hypothetical protein
MLFVRGPISNLTGFTAIVPKEKSDSSNDRRKHDDRRKIST